MTQGYCSPAFDILTIYNYYEVMVKKTLAITGAAGFIGSAFLRLALKKNHRCVIIDKLTYAGRMENIEECLNSADSIFEKIDICDFDKVNAVMQKYKPDGIVHFAAESHVDNSITGPRVFVETNIVGTFNLLESARVLFSQLTNEERKIFRFVHVSTDEVFGELEETGKFSEMTPYHPNSPYSASKAASDHLVRAWHRTYGIPTIVTNCSNNYGPRQFPEKLIPKIILNALSGEKLPIYGRGLNVRDWIHVDDHAAGVWLALEKGTPGETYCLGGNSERKNIEVVKSICTILDKKKPRADKKSYAEQITFVEDRPGHDARYAIDDHYAQKELGFVRDYKSFEQGLEATVDWYLSNQQWVKAIRGDL